MNGAITPSPAQRAVAQQIAADLFHDGTERVAHRLVMEHVIDSVPHLGAGWVESAVANRIAQHLANAKVCA